MVSIFDAVAYALSPPSRTHAGLTWEATWSPFVWQLGHSTSAPERPQALSPWLRNRAGWKAGGVGATGSQHHVGRLRLGRLQTGSKLAPCTCASRANGQGSSGLLRGFARVMVARVSGPASGRGVSRGHGLLTRLSYVPSGVPSLLSLCILRMLSTLKLPSLIIGG